MLKKLKGLFIILLFAFLIFGYYAFRYFDKSKMFYTYDEVTNMIDRAYEYNNYRIKFETISDGSDGKKHITESSWHNYKDGFFRLEERQVLENGLTTYSVLWQNNNENGYLISIQEYYSGSADDSGNKTKEFKYFSIPVNYIKRIVVSGRGDIFDYYYLGEENYNGEKCIVFELSDYNTVGKQPSGNYNTYKYYVSERTGFILYSIFNAYSGDNILSSIEKKYTIELDVVNDEDVKEPKPEDYPDYLVRDDRNKSN